MRWLLLFSSILILPNYARAHYDFCVEIVRAQGLTTLRSGGLDPNTLQQARRRQVVDQRARQWSSSFSSHTARHSVAKLPGSTASLPLQSTIALTAVTLDAEQSWTATIESSQPHNGLAAALTLPELLAKDGDDNQRKLHDMAEPEVDSMRSRALAHYVNRARLQSISAAPDFSQGAWFSMIPINFYPPTSMADLLNYLEVERIRRARDYGPNQAASDISKIIDGGYLERFDNQSGTLTHHAVQVVFELPENLQVSVGTTVRFDYRIQPDGKVHIEVGKENNPIKIKVRGTKGVSPEIVQPKAIVLVNNLIQALKV